MQLEIFDVGHGACALLTCDNGSRMMIDSGHNASTGWKPGDMLKERGVTYLELLAITNYDEDHASGLPNLLEHVDVGWLLRNKSVEAESLRELKSDDGMGVGIDCLVDMIPGYTSSATPTTSEPVFSGVERKVFYHDYPTFDDENNLSMVLHLKINGAGFLFPGDLEKKGWEELLKRSDFQAAVADTRVLIAAHHGRDGGVCDDIFAKYGCKPYWVVISDKWHIHDTQKTVDYYSSKAIGGPFNGETRYVLTTRSDGTIVFKFGPDGWSAAPAPKQANKTSLRFI